jgi:type II secretory pathway component GspD/PulD (secretin)
MKVTPVITTPGDKVEGVPGTETQTATTEVLVNDNETMMLGGLIREERSQENSSMPFADKVPGFLQKLFRSNNRSVVRSELVIFITPRIMDVDRDVAGNRHLVTDGQYDAKGFFTGSDRIFEEKGKGKGKAQKEARQ